MNRLPSLMVMKVLSGFIFLFANYGKGLAQDEGLNQAVQPVQELSLGDKVPDIGFEKMVNYHRPSARLSDFKGKLVILDFWATWCTACIKNFPKMDSLQKQFDEQLQVILVNDYDEENKVQAFFEKQKAMRGKSYLLPSVAEDTITRLLFPRRVIPHYVWIGPDGTVKAITSSQQVTAENIRHVLAGNKPTFAHKLNIDTDRPLFLQSRFPDTGLIHYSILVKGRIDALPSGTEFRRKGDIVYGRAFTNTPILSMYKSAINAIIPGFGYDGKKIRLQVKDSSALIYNKEKEHRQAWEEKNLYTMEVIVPVYEAHKLYNHVLESLNRYSRYYGKIEKQLTQCLVLVRTSNTDKIKTKGGKMENTLLQDKNQYLRNAPVSFLVNRLNRITGTTLPVIDETHYTGHIDIDLSIDFNNMHALRKKLQRYDLDLVPRKRKIEVFILTEKP